MVVPTIGRPSLRATLDSIGPQLQPEDAVVVISDGRNRRVLELVQEFSCQYPAADWTFSWILLAGNWGHPAANYALDLHVSTSHVWRLDDDDVAHPLAFTAMRAHFSDPWTIFKMTFGDGHFAKGVTCWRAQALRYGDIGTPMSFYAKGSARYGMRYEGDWDHVLELQAEFGEPVWDENVVALIRP